LIVAPIVGVVVVVVRDETAAAAAAAAAATEGSFTRSSSKTTDSLAFVKYAGAAKLRQRIAMVVLCRCFIVHHVLCSLFIVGILKL
jgi:hypothetical protein